MIGDRIIGWVRQALSDQGPEITPNTADRGVTWRLDEPNPISGTQVEQRLRSMMTTDGTLTGGSLHLVGLADLKLKLGDRWNKLSERVHLVSQKAILRHLGPRDVFFRYDDTLYVLVFADLAPEQARLITAAIVEEIYRTLLGQADLASLSVRSAVVQLDGSTVIETRSIAELLAEALVKNNSENESSPLLDKDNKSALRKPKIEVRYRPVWDIKRQVLSTYLCVPTAKVFGTTVLTGYDVLEGQPDPEGILSLDIQVLRDSVDVLDDLYRNLFRFILVIPLNIETLSQQTRRRVYVDHLRAVPDHVRNLIQISLFGLPSGTPYSRLAEFVAVLRPFVRGVFVHVSLDRHDHRVLAEAGIRVVSTGWPRGRSMQQLAEPLAHFRANSSRLHLRMFLDGVPNQTAARMVGAAGVDFIAGPAIEADLEVPQHMLRFTWDDMVQTTIEKTPA